MSACEHVNFVVKHDVHRLARTEGGPVEVFAFTALVMCYDCGLEFREIRVKLESTGRIDVKRPQLLPSSPGLVRAGGGSTH